MRDGRTRNRARELFNSSPQHLSPSPRMRWPRNGAALRVFLIPREGGWHAGHFLGMVLRNTDEDTPRLAPRELALHLTTESTLHLDPCSTLLMPPHGRERGARGLYFSEHPVAVPSPQEEIKDAAESTRRSTECRQASGRIAFARRDSTTSTGHPPPVSSRELATNLCGGSLTSSFATSEGSTW